MATSSFLHASAGIEQIDQITRGVIEIIELHLPRRIHSYYYAGSCADGAVTPLSDIDLCIVFKDAQTGEEAQQIAAIAASCKRISPRNLDISTIDEATALHADRLRFQADWRPVLGAVTLKCASLPIVGVDLRESIPFVNHDVYRRTLMHFPYLVLSGPRKNPPRLPYPLPYLDPNDEFFGYTGRLLRAPDGTLTPSTKRLVHASGFIATALVAEQTELYIADKRSAVIAYREHIHDEWADHLDAIHEYCRLRWGYGVPPAPADRQLLRELCARELAFENHFLARYQQFLAHEQHAPDEAARQFAIERLHRIAFP